MTRLHAAAVMLALLGCASEGEIVLGTGNGKADSNGCLVHTSNALSRELEPPLSVPGDTLVGADFAGELAARTSPLSLVREALYPDELRPDLVEDGLAVYDGGGVTIEHSWQVWNDGERDDTARVYVNGEPSEFFAAFDDSRINLHSLEGGSERLDEDTDHDGWIDHRAVKFDPSIHDLGDYPDHEEPERGIARVILEDKNGDHEFDTETITAVSPGLFEQIDCPRD